MDEQKNKTAMESPANVTALKTSIYVDLITIRELSKLGVFLLDEWDTETPPEADYRIRYATLFEQILEKSLEIQAYTET